MTIGAKFNQTVNNFLNKWYFSHEPLCLLIYIEKYSNQDDMFYNSLNCLKNEFTFSNLEAICLDLQAAGFINKYNSQFNITSRGKEFLQEYHQFKLKGLIEKSNIICSKKFSSLWKIISLMFFLISSPFWLKRLSSFFSYVLNFLFKYILNNGISS